MPFWEKYYNGPARVSENVWAYLQPDGGWGLNNTALLSRPS